MHIPYALKKSQIDYFKSCFNEEPEFTSVDIHPHGVLALQRKIAEQKMFQTIAELKSTGAISASIMKDIGSSPRRLRQYHSAEQLWCCMPLVLASDIFRVQEMRDNGGAGFCTHSVLDCDCTVRPSVFTSTHSLYYFNPAQIAQLISKTVDGRLFAVYHQFDNMFGHFGPEATYQVSNDSIIMKVDGNDTPYTHPNPIWLNNKSGVQLTTNLALVWNTIHVVGDTKVSVFMLAEIKLPPPIRTYSLTTLASDNTQPMYYIPMATSDHPLNAELETYTLQIDRVQSFAYGFITVMFKNSEHVPVHLPRGLVEFVASKSLFTERSGAAILDAKHHATQYCTKINMPPELFSTSILYGSILGMLATLDAEINALNTAARVNYGKLSWHSQLLKFGAFQFPYWKYFYFASPTIQFIICFVCMIGALLRQYRNRMYYSKASAFCVTYTLVTTFLNYLNFVRTRNQTWSQRRHHGDMASTNIDTPYQLVLDPEFKGVVSNKALAPQRAGSVVRVEAFDPNEPKHPGDTPTRIELATIGFSTVTPTVLEPTKNAEIQAIRNRVTRVVSEPTPEAAEKLMGVLQRKAFRDLTDITVPYNSATFNEWNRRFPGAVQKKHIEARNLITDHTHANKFHSISKAFIKMEKVSFGSTTSGIEDATPRLIQGQPAHQNVILGPWMYKFTQHMKQVWNGKCNNVYFTSGQTADDIGEWFSNCCHKYKRPAFVLIDYTKYDSTINQASRAFSDQVCIDCGIKKHPPVWDALQTDATQEGYTRHGVYYKTNDGTGSGRANTTCKNSKVNAAITLAALPDDSQFDTGVAGDDNIIIGEYDYLVDRWQNITSFATELGFEPKARFTEYVHEVDFCSKIPYPAYDPQTKRNVVVFGPKLGKLLHKLGWNLNKAGVKSQPQTMRELMKSCKHVPFIYEFAKAVNERLSDKSFKYNHDPSYWDTHKSYEPSPFLWDYVLTPRYGLTPEHLQEFIQILSIIPETLDTPVVIQYPRINDWCAVDDSM
nr:methyltransferase [Tolivirales sp.]